MSRPGQSFAQRVVALVRRIPRGRVTTYGSVAAACGSPRSARQVGWTLRHATLPWPKASRRSSTPVLGEGWQRVINREGRLSIVHPYLTPTHQASLLRKDGVHVTRSGNTYWVDLGRYLWNPTNRSTKRSVRV